MKFEFANEEHPVIPPERLAEQEQLAAAELERLHQTSDELQQELAKLDSPEMKAKFRPKHLEEQRKRVREKFVGRGSEIASELARIVDRPLAEAEFWESPTRLLRGARLTPRSKPLERSGAFVTNGEKELFEQLQQQRQSIDAVAEAAARNQLMQELLLADDADFVERLDDAVQRGNLAVVYLAGLVSKSRDQKLRSAVQHRLLKVEIPERTAAVESIKAIQEIASAANSTLSYMRGGKSTDTHRSVRRIRQQNDEAAQALLEGRRFRRR